MTCCFPQKSLPLLESQIKENQQTITEQLQKYGLDIPEDETEKMFFLIEVSSCGVALKGRTLSIRQGPRASCSSLLSVP